MAVLQRLPAHVAFLLPPGVTGKHRGKGRRLEEFRLSGRRFRRTSLAFPCTPYRTSWLICGNNALRWFGRTFEPRFDVVRRRFDGSPEIWFGRTSGGSAEPSQFDGGSAGANIVERRTRTLFGRTAVELGSAEPAKSSAEPFLSNF